MVDEKNINEYLLKVQKGFKQELPKIKAEIAVYEKKKAEGTLSSNPKIAPQFNG